AVGLHASLEVDTLDSSVFPSSGLRAIASWRRRFEELGSDADSEVVNLEGYAVETFFGQSIGLLTSMQFETGGQTQIQDVFVIGGPFRVSGLGSVALGGAEGGLASLITYREIGGSLYFGGSVEAGGVWDGWSTIDSDEVIFGGSVFTGYASPIGPIYLGYGWAEGGEKAAFFIMGQIF
ncbi:MAG TPA: BamA/TamA family outer membrane protein, partial [Planctomycetota bacterium]|nr:BamA/TamA family outer membrane protein [Planctomycetota bacterium]